MRDWVRECSLSASSPRLRVVLLSLKELIKLLSSFVTLRLPRCTTNFEIRGPTNARCTTKFEHRWGCSILIGGSGISTYAAVCLVHQGYWKPKHQLECLCRSPSKPSLLFFVPVCTLPSPLIFFPSRPHLPSQPSFCFPCNVRHTDQR